MRKIVLLVALVLLTSCARAEHEESFPQLLESQYGGVVPTAQQGALADGVVLPSEVEAAVTASLECMAEIDGVVYDDPFHWRDDGIEFGGGAHPMPGTNEAEIVPLMDACYYEYAALVETAWFDQEYLGELRYGESPG